MARRLPARPAPDGSIHTCHLLHRLAPAPTNPRSSGRTIVTELGVGTACLLVQLAMLCWLAASVRRCRLEGRLWCDPAQGRAAALAMAAPLAAKAFFSGCPTPYTLLARPPTRRSVRQQFFTRTAATLLVLQTCYTAAWTASFAIVLAQPGCGYPWRTITVFDFLQASKGGRGGEVHEFRGVGEAGMVAPSAC